MRETFGSRLGTLATMVGVAVGLGNVWRFPYMAGKYGGASFVLIYVLGVLLIGIPALMAEWSLGRSTRLGTAGAYARAGLPGGRFWGWFLVCGILVAAGYYSNAIGWVAYHAVGQAMTLLGTPWDSAAILPPASGFDARSFGLQVLMTGGLVLTCGVLLLSGLRRGIERVSRWLMPVLVASVLLVMVRALTLPGAGEGVAWYLFKFDPSALTPAACLAGIGQAVFSLSLGGTFMVVYGSYLDPAEKLRSMAFWTAVGDLGAGLLAGLAILPAVIALGLEPAAGPGLIFSTLPQVFERLAFGGVFGLIFYAGLAAAAFLSVLAACEVVVVALIDTWSLTRPQAVARVVTGVLLVSIPPMVNLEIFVPWDLTFGSGLQTLGTLVAVVTVGWSMDRARVLEQFGGDHDPWNRRLYLWLRYVVPGVILLLGVWWVLTDVLGVLEGA